MTCSPVGSLFRGTWSAQIGHRRITKDFSSLVYVLNSLNAILKSVVSSRDWKSHSRKLQVRKSTSGSLKVSKARLSWSWWILYHSSKFLQNRHGMLWIVCVHEHCKEMFSSPAWPSSGITGRECRIYQRRHSTLGSGQGSIEGIILLPLLWFTLPLQNGLIKNTQHTLYVVTCRYPH